VASVTSNALTPSREVSPGPEGEFEFSDVSALMCLLCARQFKNLDQLKRHNKDSDLHKVRILFRPSLPPTDIVSIKKNFKDPNLRDVARQKAASRKAANPEVPKYRDRASERRTLFNQPDAPLPEKDVTHGTVKRKHAEVTPHSASSTPTAAPVNPANDKDNVGNKLLKMMGWKEGTGLGSEGEGRVNPMLVLTEYMVT